MSRRATGMVHTVIGTESNPASIDDEQEVRRTKGNTYDYLTQPDPTGTAAQGRRTLQVSAMRHGDRGALRLQVCAGPAPVLLLWGAAASISGLTGRMFVLTLPAITPANNDCHIATTITRHTMRIMSDPPQKPYHPDSPPDVPPLQPPGPGVPKPGDPPGVPRPGDPPPTEPRPDTPDPMKPKSTSIGRMLEACTLTAER